MALLYFSFLKRSHHKAPIVVLPARLSEAFFFVREVVLPFEVGTGIYLGTHRKNAAEVVVRVGERDTMGGILFRAG